jgi:hypothetical protein
MQVMRKDVPLHRVDHRTLPDQQDNPVMLRRALPALLTLLLCAFVVRAQDTPLPPAPDALRSIIIPMRDRADLARRLSGLTDADLPSTPLQPPAYALGDRQVFSALNTSARRRLTVPATLRALGDHLAVWVQEGERVDQRSLDQLVTAFDTFIYPEVRALWGSEALPGVDGDPRIHALFVRDLGETTAAYFAGDHTYPAAVYPFSNAREMFFFNLDALGGIAQSQIERIVAHEFQHMIRHHRARNSDTWFNEGLSVLTEHILYGGADGTAIAYLLTPGVQLTDWNADPYQRAANYGAAGLFMTYLYQRLGREAVIALGAHPAARGWTSVEAIAARYAAHADALFADWLIANLWLTLGDARSPLNKDGTPIPLYTDLIGFRTPPPTYPLDTAQALPPYSARHYRLNAPPPGASLVLTGQPDTGLIADSGDGRFWLSARADMSETRLTYSFNLAGLDAPQLAYRVWHDLEDRWDYGHVFASTDGSAWVPLASSGMTADDPHGVAYGVGYTGVSEGWIDQTIDLSGYAGAERLLIRFSVITDDAINRPGMAIDDVRLLHAGGALIPAAPDAEGWLETDNHLRARFLLQAVVMSGSEARVLRAIGSPNVTLPLPDVPMEVVWAIVSPIVPHTTEMLTWRLTLE